MAKTINFNVVGKPLTQGSMTPMRNPHTGKLFMKHKKGLTDWRRWVGDAAYRAMQEQSFQVTSMPVSVYINAYLVRPKKHYRTGKFSGVLRDDAPALHSQAPDVDKLARAILDAMTDIVYRDDSQVCSLSIAKKWIARDESPGVYVHVLTVDNIDAAEPYR